MTLQSAVAQDVLVDNDFDDGTSQDWTLANSASIYSGTTYSYNSTPHALALSTGTGGTATLTDPLALISSGYTNVTWRFYVNSPTGGYGEKYYFEYSNNGGSNWIQLAGGSLQYLATGFKEYSISTANLSDNFLFRIRMNDSSPKSIYADSMLITATPEVPPAGTLITIK